MDPLIGPYFSQISLGRITDGQINSHLNYAKFTHHLILCGA